MNHAEEATLTPARVLKFTLLTVWAVFMGAMIWVNWHESKVKFMSECRKDHKQYECDVLWGQAN